MENEYRVFITSVAKSLKYSTISSDFEQHCTYLLFSLFISTHLFFKLFGNKIPVISFSWPTAASNEHFARIYSISSDRKHTFIFERQFPFQSAKKYRTLENISYNHRSWIDSQRPGNLDIPLRFLFVPHKGFGIQLHQGKCCELCSISNRRRHLDHNLIHKYPWNFIWIQIEFFQFWISFLIILYHLKVQ